MRGYTTRCEDQFFSRNTLAMNKNSGNMKLSLDFRYNRVLEPVKEVHTISYHMHEYRSNLLQ